MMTSNEVDQEAQLHRLCLLADQKQGSITKKPLSTLINAKSALFFIQNARLADNKSTAAVSDWQSFQRKVAFTCMAFSHDKVPAEEGEGSDRYRPFFAAVDQRGHLYMFDLKMNRFWLAGRTGVSGSAISFHTARRGEVIVALSDSSIHCFNYDTCQLQAKLQGYHRLPVTHISAHPSQALVLTSSEEEAILWDSHQWTRKRVLAGAKSIGVQQAMFSPSGSDIAVYFSDGTVSFWKVDGFSMVWKVALPQMSSAVPSSRAVQAPMALQRSGSYLAVASNHGVPSIYIWDMAEKQLVHEITIPSFQEQGGIERIEFIGMSIILAVLSYSHQVVFVDAKESRLKGHMPTTQEVIAFSSSWDGALAAIQYKESSSVISLWSLNPILEQKVEKAIPTFLKPIIADNPVSSRTKEAEPEGKLKETAICPRPTSGPVKDKTKSVSREKLVSVETSKPRPKQTFFELAMLNDDNSRLNRRKLRIFIRHFGEFPAHYRKLIWRFLLQLPENRHAFDALISRETHPSLRDFQIKFPMKSQRLARAMEKVMSSLVYWSPVFENLDYLPAFLYPFLKTFETDVFSCLESVMTIITNWCQLWWEYHPNPPVQVLDYIEDLLALHDKSLLNHFVRCKISSQVYAWPLLHSVFSEIFSADEWLKVWDHILVNHPRFMIVILVAYLRQNHTALMSIQSEKEFRFFLSRMNPVSLNTLIGDAYKLEEKTPKSFLPKLKAFTPLPKDHYPVFNKYPEYIVNYQKKLREKIRAEEDEYLRKKKITEEIHQLSEELRRDQKAWKDAEQAKTQAVENLWNKVLEEEEEHVHRQSKLDTMDKAKRIDALKAIAEARKQVLTERADHDVLKAQMYEEGKSQRVGLNHELLDVNKKLDDLTKDWLERRKELVKEREDQENASLMFNQ